MARRRDKGQERAIAARRLRALLVAAQEESRRGETTLPDRYSHLARRLAMRHQVRLPSEARIVLCRGCQGYRAPGKQVRVRMRGGRLVTTCLRCGRVDRRPTGVASG